MKKLFILAISCCLLSALSWANTFDFNNLGQLPVLYNGRLQPFDTVARNGLITIKEKTTIKRTSDTQSSTISPTQWLWEVLCHQPAILTDKIFLIHDPTVKHEFKLNSAEKYFSYEDLKNIQFDIFSKAEQYKDLENPSAYKKNILKLSTKIALFNSFLHGFVPFDDLSFGTYLNRYLASVKQGLPLFLQYNKIGTLASQKEELLLIEFNQFFKQHRQFVDLSILFFYPAEKNPSDTNLWTNTGSELLKQLDVTHKTNPILIQYGELTSFYNENQFEKFNFTVKEMLNTYQSSLGLMQSKITFEYYFNQANPFFWAMSLYLIVFIGMFVYYLTKKTSFYRFITWCCYSAFTIHTIGLLARMIIQWRPPVTNLYSSAVFVGWVAIGLCFLLEKIFKNKLGNMVAAILGFSTLIIAHHLALQGDTLEQMQAVLDSNFWLTTHVITITLGYGGTFLAGAIATVYVIQVLFNKCSPDLAKQQHKMTYAIICFSLFFSFVGTILGGIWADQSWGRFWGWDPKENGALLIVLWNSLILHARLAGVIHTRGLMIMSLFGNIVTAFAWFGVNMLGVGLHSYGFMDKLFNWLIAYTTIQLGLMLLGSLKENVTKI